MFKDQIQDDLKNAMKGGDAITLSVLRMTLSAINEKEKIKRYNFSKEGLSEEDLVLKSKLNDEEVMDIIFSEVKKRKDSIKEFEKGNREDLVSKEKAELDCLLKYLPQQMSEEELRPIVQKAIDESGKDFGKIMSVIMPQVKGKADGSQISAIVKELLQ
ncbi:MAG: GatB/YqeY domain-containing protein [Candidatus Pacebacteria bacterium]|nr:GatB/YqeY domain-containing protein [Candidatus Paceibacterota bacterium]